MLFTVKVIFTNIIAMLLSEENVDHLCNLDEDVSYSSLSELEKLEKAIQSDQCFIRYIVFFIVLLISVLECYSHVCSSVTKQYYLVCNWSKGGDGWDDNSRPGGK